MALKNNTPISANSLADVAFLLLTFFVIATSMDVKEGITSKIRDPYAPYIPIDVKPENVLILELGTQRDNILIDKIRKHPLLVKEMVKNHVLNYAVNPNYSESPEKALIMIRSLSGTPYELYITVKNQIDAAFNEIWNSQMQKIYGFSLEQVRQKLKSASEKERDEALKMLKDITESKFKKQLGESRPESI